MKSFQKLKQRLGVNSNTQFIIIMLVFAITGSLALYLSEPILGLLSLHPNTTNTFLYYPMRIAIVFPVYQVVLIVVGTLFGQFNFFWNLEKKMINRLGLNWVLEIFK